MTCQSVVSLAGKGGKQARGAGKGWTAMSGDDELMSSDGRAIPLLLVKERNRLSVKRKVDDERLR